MIQPTSSRPRGAALLHGAAAAALAFLFLLCGTGRAAAAVRAPAAPAVTVAMISSPQLTLDSNKPCAEGPRAAYVAFRVTNTSGVAQTNLRATISGFASGITLGGGQAASQYVGTIAAGQSKVLYWFVAYPCTFGNAATLTVSVTDNTAGAATGTGTVTTSSMVSAQAGGVLMSGTLGPGAVVGQVITFDVGYEFGGVSAGDSYNLQVAGNQSFDARCFQLVRMQVVSSGVTAASVGTADTPFFAASVSQGGSKHPLVVRYFFKYLCANVSSTARPYGNQFSGGQLKYSSNYETFVGPTLPIATNPFTVTKSASPRVMPATGTVTYTVTIANPSQFPAEMDSIVDRLPMGMVYDTIAPASGVTAGNSGSIPARNATGTLVWRGIPGTSYALPAFGSITLVYRATVTKAGELVNGVSAHTGTETLAADADTVWAGTANVSVAKTGPAAAATGDTLRYFIVTTNAGGDSARRVIVSDSLPAGVTFVSATRSATHSAGVVTWPAILALASGASRTDTVVVVAPAAAGTLTNVARARASTHDPTPGDNDGTAAGSRTTTTVGALIDVTPKGIASPLPRLPGKYAQVFTVTHGSNAPRSFDLLARIGGTAATPGVFLAVDSLRGAGITAQTRSDSARVTLAANTAYAVTVWYTVPAGDTAVNVEYLRARAASDSTRRSEGWVDVRRVFPSLTLSKAVSPTGVLSPGTELTYTLAFSNVGEFAAEGVVVADSVPPQVLFKPGSAGQVLPAGITAQVEYSSASTGTAWSYTPVSGGCGAPSGYDGCVRRIRWLLTGSLPAGAAASSGTVQFVARIR
ncbi:MAG TPA: DUF11 domain-containing protein [Longimicrobium sp.]|nr:DUF11 domain-containing protein [Longimicrobium sp.]